MIGSDGNPGIEITPRLFDDGSKYLLGGMRERILVQIQGNLVDFFNVQNGVVGFKESC